MSERRSIIRNFHVALQFPVSGILRGSGWSNDIHVQVLNYHYRGACLQGDDLPLLTSTDFTCPDITFDFYLGQKCLKTNVPVRITWNDAPASGTLGIEFLAHSGEFVDRADRYLCHKEIMPQIKATDPLDMNRHTYYKVIDVSSSGMLLSTSLTNKHLVTGMTITDAELVIPGEQPLELCLRIHNTRSAPTEGSFYLGVEVLSSPSAFRKVVSSYLGTMNANFLGDVEQESLSRDSKIRANRLKQGLTFRTVTTEEEYREVLRLRYQGYSAKGKVQQDATLDTQGEGLSREGTIIGAYLAGTLVASMELRFGDVQSNFRTFDVIPRERLAAVDIANTVEGNRLVIDPRVQGTDIFMGMIQKLHAIIMARGGKDVLLLATTKLMPLYRKIGSVELGIHGPHPSLPGEQLNVMLLKKDAFLDGRFLKPSTWTQLYQATNEFFATIYEDALPMPAFSLESSGVV